MVLHNSLSPGSGPSLPTELIALISEFAYQLARPDPDALKCQHYRNSGESEDDDSHRHCRLGCESMPWNAVWPDQDDIHASSTLFPYSLAGVCSAWRDTLSINPLYWTRIIVYIDQRTPPPIEQFKTYVTLSGDLPISVVVTRKSYEDAEYDESKHVRPIVASLRPHLSRCYSIHFDLLHSTYLPSVGADFHGTAPMLRALKLECRVYDGDINDPPEMLPHQRVSFPFLNNLILDGRTFFEAYTVPGWQACLRSRGRISISISHYSPPWEKGKCGIVEHVPPKRRWPGDKKDDVQVLQVLNLLQNRKKAKSISLHHMLILLAHIPSIETLKIQDVSIPFSKAHDRPGIQKAAYVLYARHVFLSDLRKHLISAIGCITHMESSSLCITRSPITYLDPPDIADMALRELDCNSKIITLFLRNWHGSSLEFSGCKGFDDEVLAWLAKKIAAGSLGLRTLHIIDCANFSVEGLKDAVHTRATKHGNFRTTWNKQPLAHLTVCGWGPAVDQKDAEALRQQVGSFTWNTTQKDGSVCRPFDGVAVKGVDVLDNL